MEVQLEVEEHLLAISRHTLRRCVMLGGLDEHNVYRTMIVDCYHVRVRALWSITAHETNLIQTRTLEMQVIVGAMMELQLQVPKSTLIKSCGSPGTAV